jgi:hypothetical protein
VPATWNYSESDIIKQCMCVFCLAKLAPANMWVLASLTKLALLCVFVMVSADHHCLQLASVSMMLRGSRIY